MASTSLSRAGSTQNTGRSPSELSSGLTCAPAAGRSWHTARAQGRRASRRPGPSSVQSYRSVYDSPRASGDRPRRERMRVSLIGQAAFGEAVLERLIADGVEIAGVSAPAPE